MQEIQGVTRRDLQNAIEAAGQRAAHEASRAARREIAQRALQPVDAVVVAVDGNNRVQIRRQHMDDPDPGFYQLTSPAVIPAVGDRIFGASSSGTLLLLGAEPGAGYVDINGVRQGNLFDASLTNSKLQTDSVDARLIRLDAVGDLEIRNRSVQNYNIAFDSIRGDEIEDRRVGNVNIAFDTLAGNEIQDYGIGDSSFATDSVGSRTVQERSLYGYQQLVLRSVDTGEISYKAVGPGEIMDGGVGYNQLSNDSVGGGAIRVEAVGIDEIANSLNNPSHGSYGLRTLYGGTANSAAGGSHRHSGNDTIPYWIDALSMDQRDDWLETKHRVEAIDTSVPLQGEGLADLIALVAHTHSMLTSNFRYSAEELQAKLRNDIDYRHEFLMDQDEAYYARWWTTFDPSYRVRNAGNHFVEHGLENCPSLIERHGDYAGTDRVVPMNESWIQEKLSERPREDYGLQQTNQAYAW